VTLNHRVGGSSPSQPTYVTPRTFKDIKRQIQHYFDEILESYE